MPVDENEFFKNATLKICGGLELEKTLCDCLLYVQEFIPGAVCMGLHLYNREEGTLETVVYTDRAVWPGVPVKTKLSQRARELVERQRSLRIRCVERLGDYEVGAANAARLGASDHASVLLDLVLNNTMLGILSVESVKPLPSEHVHLLSLLVKPCAIAFTNSMRYREMKRLQEMLADENRYLQNELLEISGTEIIGGDQGLARVMAKVRQVASLDSPVLLLGETGTGKEVIANAIHRLSNRAHGPFIKVNCGAIPLTLLDSELFGYEKGAFTGATARRRGRIERANGGTLFLDEIGELPAEAQVRLLRVLQEKEFDRIGGEETVNVNVRVIAATNRDLGEMMRKRQFRPDLFFRLQIFPITLPPLRQRKEDIPSLITHFIEKKAREMQRRRVPTVAPGALSRLMRYDWPGNIRELENTVERSLILDNGNWLFFNEIATLQQDESMMPVPMAGGEEDYEILTLDEVIKSHIRKVINRCNGRIAGDKGAAKMMDINPSTLRNKIRKFGIGRKTT